MSGLMLTVRGAGDTGLTLADGAGEAEGWQAASRGRGPPRAWRGLQQSCSPICRLVRSPSSAWRQQEGRPQGAPREGDRLGQVAVGQVQQRWNPQQRQCVPKGSAQRSAGAAWQMRQAASAAAPPGAGDRLAGAAAGRAPDWGAGALAAGAAGGTVFQKLSHGGAKRIRADAAQASVGFA